VFLEFEVISLAHFNNIHLLHIMGSLGPIPATNGNHAVNGSTPVNGHSPAEAYLEPIAVVGMSCRLPGEASDTQKLWELLTKGRSAWSKVPTDRWNQSAFHDPAAEGKPGRTSTDGGHFLKDDIKAFDASFFGVNPIEATVSIPIPLPSPANMRRNGLTHSRPWTLNRD
jgi:hypothetical protein